MIPICPQCGSAAVRLVDPIKKTSQCDRCKYRAGTRWFATGGPQPTNRFWATTEDPFKAYKDSIDGDEYSPDDL